MATALLVILHLAALAVFFPALFVTVPAHLIYSKMAGASSAAPATAAGKLPAGQIPTSVGLAIMAAMVAFFIWYAKHG